MNAQNNRQKPCYEVGTGKELRDKYGLTAENRPTVKLNSDRVPAGIHTLIPHAEKWGIGDDLIRGDVIDQANKESLSEFVRAYEQAEQETLWNWLTGSEANNPNEMSAEYIAFSSMVIAYEEARIRLEHWNSGAT